MSAKRNRAGLLAHIIASNDHDHCLALRSAWADTRDIDTHKVAITGVTLPRILEKFLQKKTHIKGVKELKNGVIVVTLQSEAAMLETISLLNGVDFSKGKEVRPFSKGKVRAYPVPPKEEINDIDFSTFDKFKIRSIHDDSFFIRFVIAGNGDMFFAYRQRSDRDKIRPDKRFSPGDRNYWTLVKVYENGTIGEKENGHFDTDMLNKQLEFLAGKESNLTRKSREVMYRVVDNGVSRNVAASLLGEIADQAQYKFARASNVQDDRSSLLGWKDRPGQWSPNKKGTLNSQFLAETFARDHGFVDPDIRTIEQTHGQTVGFVKGKIFGKEKEIVIDRDSLTDLSPARIAADRRIAKMIEDEEKLQAKQIQKPRLKSSPAQPLQKKEASLVITDRMKDRFFKPPIEKIVKEEPAVRKLPPGFKLDFGPGTDERW